MPKSLPSEDDTDGILALDISVAPALCVTVFLNRLKIAPKLNLACRLKAEVEKHKNGQKLTIEELTDTAKEDYGRLARSYATHLFKETRSHFDFTTLIAQGLGSFDLEMLLSCSLPSVCGVTSLQIWNHRRRRNICRLWMNSWSIFLSLTKQSS